MTRDVGELKITAEGDVCHFKVRLVRAISDAGHGICQGLSGQAHVGIGVREHVEILRWKTRYDESAKLFDENLQNS